MGLYEAWKERKASSIVSAPNGKGRQDFMTIGMEWKGGENRISFVMRAAVQ